MVTQIDVASLKREIEKQKNESLYGNIHVWADSSSASYVSTICGKYSSITENPNLFHNHSFSASSNPGQLVRELASSFPRVLVVAICNFDPQKVTENWVRQQFSSYGQRMPFADLRFIRVNGISSEDQIYLENFGFKTNPTILVFKMGHLIDCFSPNISELQSSAKPSVLDQLRFRDAQIASDLERCGPPPAIVEEDLMRGVDRGRAEWEQREREKRSKEAEKEAQERLKEKLRVKARIEEQRRLRQQGGK